MWRDRKWWKCFFRQTQEFRLSVRPVGSGAEAKRRKFSVHCVGRKWKFWLENEKLQKIFIFHLKNEKHALPSLPAALAALLTAVPSLSSFTGFFARTWNFFEIIILFALRPCAPPPSKGVETFSCFIVVTPTRVLSPIAFSSQSLPSSIVKKIRKL